MKKPVRVILICISVIAALLCVLCILFIAQYLRGKALSDRLSASVSASVITAPPTTQLPSADSQPDVEPTEDETKYMSIDIDFDELKAMNDEIYAWIEVPGTVISYAVVQSADDDLFYNTHAVDRSYYSGGSIYSQRYNCKDFQDNVTVLYGHNRHSQTMFAQVNNFADAQYFDEIRYIYIYTPEKVYQYEIFAAYPHSSEHLLLCHDFNDPEEFAAYFDGLTDGVNANYRRELFPSFGDKVLTLSTCYKQNRMQRYLVQGVLVQEYTVIHE